jgi:hypothetical protein
MNANLMILKNEFQQFMKFLVILFYLSTQF